MNLDQTLAALGRRVMQEALRQKVHFYFDYRGPVLSLEPSDRAVVECADQLLQLLLPLVTVAHSAVFFSTEVRPAGTGRAVVVIRLLDLGSEATGLIGEGLEQAGGAALPSSWQDTPADLSDIEQMCRQAGGILRVRSGSDAGRLYELEFVLSPLAVTEPPPLDGAQGLEAWLIGSPPIVFEAITRRLQRLGWGVRVFTTMTEAKAFTAHGAGTTPALTVGAEPFLVSYEDFSHWCRSLDPRVQCMFAAATHQRLDLLRARTDERVQPVLIPFSATELHELTRRAIARFPVAPAQQEGARLLRDRPRILVVDDNELNRELAEQMLWALGYETDAVGDGVQAVDYCRHHVPAAVVMDLNMPHMDGLQATREIRRMESEGNRPAIPILASTASLGYATEAQCREAGMNGFLPKPVDLSVMHKELARFLREPVH